MAAVLNTIVTGDSTSFFVKLTWKKVPFDASFSDISVKLVKKDNTAQYMDTPSIQSPDFEGADWGTGLIGIYIPGELTSGITYQGEAILEVQARLQGSLVVDKTWFIPVTVRKGWID